MALLFKITYAYYFFVVWMTKEHLLEVLIEKEQLELAHTRRKIEKYEKEHAFLLSKTKRIEERMAELRLCLKG